MRFIDWLKPGLQIKRWFVVGLIGVLFLAISIGYCIKDILPHLNGWMRFLIALLGIFLIFFSIRSGLTSLFKILYMKNTMTGKLDRPKINKMIYDKRILSKGPKVVVIGGGTGLSVLLRGIKLFTSNITAIVTVADDGGGSGKLREDLGMLPPGDIRSCILALAEMEPTMEKLLQYRFTEGTLKGQSFGNLLIASMNGISDSFEEAIKKISQVLAVTGNVYPVTQEDIILYAKLKNGIVVKGESNIPVKSLEEGSPIDIVFIKPRNAEAVQEALEAIEQADVVILGPGSLYTSIIPNLLVKNIGGSLMKTSAIKIYVPNLMTQPGETDGYSVFKHVEAILRHCSNLSIDYVIANNGDVNEFVQEKYRLEGASLIKVVEEDRRRLKSMGIQLIEENLIEVKKDYVRHNAEKLSRIIIDLAIDNKIARDRNRVIDYFYNKDITRKIN